MNPTPVRTMDLRVGLKWTAQYHGPNPWAESAVVAGELAGHAHVDLSQVEAACADLWAHSGLQRGDEDPLHQAGGDVLLALGRAATQWAMAVLNEVRGLVLHAGARREGDVVCLWVGFHHAPLSRSALQLALGSLVRLLKGEIDPPALKADLDRLWLSCRHHHPDWQARILMVAARQLDIPFLEFPAGRRCWQFGWGVQSRVFFETASNVDGALGWEWQRNKVTSKALMRALGVPTPDHELVTQENELLAAASRVGFPCVVKPLDNGGGKGVTANIKDRLSLQQAFREARRFSGGPVMVEQHVAGLDYRLMVINGKLLAAIERQASFVVGDGASTVRELLDRLNMTRFENLVKSRYLRPIPVDELLMHHLSAQGLDLAAVPDPGQKVTLRSNANRSTGGICTDVTHRLHPEVRALAECLAQVTGLAAAGLDYLTSDISRSPWESNGAFIEINATPGMAVFVAAGWQEGEIGRILLGEGLGRIPVELTIVPQARLQDEAKSRRRRLLEENEAWACGRELCVGAARMQVQTDLPWAALQAGLRIPRVQRLHVLCSGVEIQRLGVPLDRLACVDLQDPALDLQWVRVLQAACRSGGEFRARQTPESLG